MTRITKITMLLLNSHITKLSTLWCLTIMLSSLSLIGQAKKYTDGPYIFHTKDSIHIKYVLEGKPNEMAFTKDEATTFDVAGLPKVDLTDLDRTYKYQGTYTDVSKIFAFSDVHGQYDLMIDLLKGNQIIDNELNWSFGDGHMVVTGDNFDRGDKVLDILWFFYELEKEAAKAGGKVHILLGNHESMVLTNDLRYLHRKYNYTSGAFRTRYDQFFKKGSVLGDWLTNHNVTTSINGHLFVHGGISAELLEEYPTIDHINKEFINYLIHKDDPPIAGKSPEENLKSEERLDLLIADKGPIWYRGYFNSEEVSADIVSGILKKLDQDVIIVGHTSLEEISPLYDGKIIAIDCSIKLGEKAAGLLIDQSGYYSCDQSGKHESLPMADQTSDSQCLFDHIYKSESLPRIDITTNVKRLVRRSQKEEYEPALSTISYDDFTFELPTRVRARGNIRKQVCTNPPLKLDFKTGQLDSMGFDKRSDKLKLVLPCDGSNYGQEKLYDEFAIYGMYQLIEPRGIRAKLVQVVLRDEQEVKKDFIGFLVEDEEQYATKHNASVIEKGVVTEHALERTSFLRMGYFQFMIANTDWNIRSKHNVELIKYPTSQEIVALPYDFDYSGFVGQKYAVPHESLPIKSIHERYFQIKKVTEEEMTATSNFFLSLEDKFHAYIDAAPYWSEKSKNKRHKHLDDFYKIIKKPKALRRYIKN